MRGLFAPAPQPALASSPTSAAGLVLPGIPSTAWMLGLAPVAEGHGWLDNVVRAYLVARDYLGPFEAARGRSFDRYGWIRVLLGLYPPEEYLCQLAILNHAATRDELTQPVQERYLAGMRPEAAGAVRRAMAGGVDGQRRWFLARQLVLRAMRVVLLPPEAAAQGSPDPVLEADLAGVIDPETAAVLLVHLIGDALYGEIPDGGPRLCGIPETVAMEMIANNLFYDRDDVGDLLARYRMLWLDYGARLKRFQPRLPPGEMLREAAGIGLDEMITMGFLYWSCLQARTPDDPLRLKAMAAPDMTISREEVETFLGLFSATPADLTDALRKCPQPWQMQPIQARPLLRLDDDVVVLDERYLVERVTRGLYWLVHDHEKTIYGENPRRAWTQVWSEMIETRAEDELRQLAPRLIGGGRAFFTEEHLMAAFPGSKNCDAGIDFGGDVVLAEIVSGTVKVPTRELADASSFRQDAEKIVIRKARQLYETAANLLRKPQPATSPLSAPPARIFPVVVIGGQFPVNPLTIRYITEQLAAEGHQPDGTVQSLTVMDLEELEGCHALWERRNQTLPQLLDACRNSPYRDAAFRNYLSYEIGGQELGRPADIQEALAESFTIIQQHLGTPGQWTPPDKLHDQVTRQSVTSPESAPANPALSGICRTSLWSARRRGSAALGGRAGTFVQHRTETGSSHGHRDRLLRARGSYRGHRARHSAPRSRA